MLPIVTPDEMRVIDANAPVPESVLIERAGAAVARAAVRMLGGTYGRRVVVIAGKGNNGNDGRVAASRLVERGVKVKVLTPDAAVTGLPPADLVIDAAFGTGFRGSWDGPPRPAAPVLAVDIPSGVDGLTGRVSGRVLEADRTVTFAALKPGLLLPPGSGFAGDIELVDIGLDASHTRAHLAEASDVANWLPLRRLDAHKWSAATWIVAGSPGMTGAARLAAQAAQRAGAGMIRLSTPGVPDDPKRPTEVVGVTLPLIWERALLADLERFHSLVIGPGLGRSDASAASVRAVVAGAPIPVVVDGDGLWALAWGSDGPRGALRGRIHPTVLTPHDGEYALLHGSRPVADRMEAARALARELGVVVLLKGSATIAADELGRVIVVNEGDQRLATAGTGDVLSGIIGALLAQRVPALEAAAMGAWLHASAANFGHRHGLVAGDLPDLIPAAIGNLPGLR